MIVRLVLVQKVAHVIWFQDNLKVQRTLFVQNVRKAEEVIFRYIVPVIQLSKLYKLCIMTRLKKIFDFFNRTTM